MDTLRRKIRDIIFGTDTRPGRAFDSLLLAVIVVSAVTVMLETVDSIDARFDRVLDIIGWTSTLLFTIEYLLRIWSADRPLHYAFGFFGIVDWLAVFPFYLSFFIPGSRYLLIIRILRLLRVFRVFQLKPFVLEVDQLLQAFQRSGRRIAVFLLFVVMLVVLLGASMYLIEDEAAGFTSIPVGIYWAIVTLTTVGYGDISPRTGLGQALAAIIMILGYSLIIVPTGFVSVAAARGAQQQAGTRECPQCKTSGHNPRAKFCDICGAGLP